MNDNQRYFVEEFAEDYLAGRMARRDLLRRVFLITGSAAAAATALVALGCGSKASAPSTTTTGAAATPATPPATPAPAGGSGTMPPAAITTDFVVKPDDPGFVAQTAQFPGAAGPIFGYLAKPKSGTNFPGIIVVPENRGLVEPNMDIARRYAKEGFAALAVDLVSRAGGSDKYVSDPAQVPAILGRMDPADLVSDLQSALNYLKTVDGVRKDRLGVTGFCFGGTQTFALATSSPEILAAVPYYGTVKPEDIAKSKAAFCCFYGELDTRVTSTQPAAEAALKAAGLPEETHIEPGAMHAFFNNTGQAYNPAAARDAWPRSVAWFNKYLKG
jgi:carboxymethylenebutenolidase